MRDRHVGHAFKVQAVLFGDLDIVAQAGDLVQHHAPRPGHTAEDRHEDHIDRKQRAERQRHGQGAAMLQVHAHQQYRKARQNRQRGQAADHGRGLAVMAPGPEQCAQQHQQHARHRDQAEQGAAQRIGRQERQVGDKRQVDE